MPRVRGGDQSEAQAFGLILCWQHQLGGARSKSIVLPVSSHYLWHLEFVFLSEPVSHIPEHLIFHLLEHKDWDCGVLVVLAPSSYDTVEGQYLGVDSHLCWRFQHDVYLCFG